MNDIHTLTQIFKILSVDTRIRIIHLLQGGTLCAGALAARLDVTQGAVSQHLRILQDAGLVIAEKRGHYIHYHLSEETLSAWRDAIEGLLGGHSNNLMKGKGGKDVHGK